MVKIKIDERYWLRSSVNSWDLCVERYVKDIDSGRSVKALHPLKFFGSIRSALDGYMEYALKQSDAESFADLVLVANECKAAIERANNEITGSK